MKRLLLSAAALVSVAALASLQAFAASPNPGNPVFGNLTATGIVSGAGFTNFVNAQAPVAAWSGAGFGFTSAPSAAQVVAGLSGQTFNNLLTSGTATINGTGGTLNVNYIGGTEPPNGVFLTSSGNATSYASISGSVPGDHQRAQGLFINTTQAGPSVQENTLGLESTINTGYAASWYVSTAYATGTVLRNNMGIYTAIVGGTSAATGTGPNVTSGTQTDGTVTWQYTANGALGAKVGGVYEGIEVYSGAGGVWGNAGAMTLNTGWHGNFAAYNEYDFGNNALDCVPGGGTNCFAEELTVGGQYPITTFLQLGGAGNGSGGYAAHYGIFIGGAYAIEEKDIFDNASGAVGLCFCTNGGGTPSHSIATIDDSSTSPASINNSGVHTYGTIWDQSSGTRAVVDATGTYITASWADAATAPEAMLLAGTYSVAAISTVGATGTVAFLSGPNQIINGAGGISAGTAPASVPAAESQLGWNCSGGNAEACLLIQGSAAPSASQGFSIYQAGTANTLAGSTKIFSVDKTGNLAAAAAITGDAGFVVDASGPTITSGSAVPTTTQPSGSIYLRTSGSTGARLYVTSGSGTWTAVAGV